MATWTPKVKLIDIRLILSDRKELVGLEGDIYKDFRNFKKSQNEIIKKEESSPSEDLTIQNIKKVSVFKEEITDFENKIIEQRVQIQQKKFQEFERREFEKKSLKLLQLFDFLVDEEIERGLKDNDYDEEETIGCFAQPGYLQKIRKSLARMESKVEQSSMTLEQLEAYDNLMNKRKRNSKKSKHDNEGPAHIHTVGRLALDKAIQQMESDPSLAMKGWSIARINAFKNLKTNPNVYYYRFNAPGEEQRTGPWTDIERKLFFDRLKEVGAEGQWGIFSMTIPGRVGYQCSNYYRLLIKNKEIIDKNYIIDPKGKIRYLFSTNKKDANGEIKKTIRVHNKHNNNNNNNNNNNSSKKGISIKSKKRIKLNNDDDGLSLSEFNSTSDDEFIMDNNNNNKNKNNLLRNKLNEIDNDLSNIQLNESPKYYYYSDDDDNNSNNDNNIDNPLPGFIDPITLDEIIQPAISPYGHVMGYANWVRCLNTEGSKNICPLTKQPLTKRDLVILSFDNIEQYRDKIVNQ